MQGGSSEPLGPLGGCTARAGSAGARRALRPGPSSKDTPPKAAEYPIELGPYCSPSHVRAEPCQQSGVRPWVVSPHRRAGFTEAPNGEEEGLMAPPLVGGPSPWIQNLNSLLEN